MADNLTQAERIAEAADKVAANWPALTDEGKAALSRVMATVAVARIQPKRRLGRAA